MQTMLQKTPILDILKRKNNTYQGRQMSDIKLVVVDVSKLTKTQKQGVLKLRQECFSEVSPLVFREHFVAKRFARIFAYDGKEIIGGTGLFKRDIDFAGQKVFIGGLGGVCVLPKYRRLGIASKMVKKGLEILKKDGCDVAGLTVNLEKNIHSLYEKAEFVILKQKSTFTDIHGLKNYLDITMLAPLNSVEKFNYITNSKKTFHWGKGYW